jgi:D-alanine-D-alanine ligase
MSGTLHSVAVVAGGLSFEREVSLRSGRCVGDALRSEGYTVTHLDADETLVKALRAEEFEAVFMALHGRYGEDGTVPALLDLLGIPFTGSGFEASRLAWDKLSAKTILRRAGLRTPVVVPVSKGALEELGVGAILDQAVRQLGLPLVVKPNRGGSALGVRVVEGADELGDALFAALSYDDTAFMERAVEGAEVAIAVVDGLPELPVVQIQPRQGRYDFAARYSHGATEFTAPAAIDAELTARCQAAARAAHRALGCRDLSRVDAILDPDGTCWILEVDTGPGLTETSLVPTAVNAAGISFPAFAVHLANRALARRPR